MRRPCPHRPTEYPRMRGADGASTDRPQILGLGHPPGARGRPDRGGPVVQAERRTPACGGPTGRPPSCSPGPQENPRVRGADSGQVGPCRSHRGEPTRARGHLRRFARRMERENPRVRGADVCPGLVNLMNVGEPPRARGRQRTHHQGPPNPRRTPACAGPTPTTSPTGRRSRRTPACAGPTPPARPSRTGPSENPRVRGADLAC